MKTNTGKPSEIPELNYLLRKVQYNPLRTLYLHFSDDGLFFGNYGRTFPALGAVYFRTPDRPDSKLELLAGSGFNGNLEFLFIPEEDDLWLRIDTASFQFCHLYRGTIEKPPFTFLAKCYDTTTAYLLFCSSILQIPVVTLREPSVDGKSFNIDPLFAALAHAYFGSSIGGS